MQVARDMFPIRSASRRLGAEANGIDDRAQRLFFEGEHTEGGFAIGEAADDGNDRRIRLEAGRIIDRPLKVFRMLLHGLARIRKKAGEQFSDGARVTCAQERQQPWLLFRVRVYLIERSKLLDKAMRRFNVGGATQPHLYGRIGGCDFPEFVSLQKIRVDAFDRIVVRQITN
ncbi:MAG: hypothetical protein NVS2B5_28010 [Beijerinckiaceae bacterium]